MLLQYLNNVSKIDLYTSSPTSVRKIVCLLFATTCLAVALPSLALCTRWKPGRWQSLPHIWQYESNHTTALRRVEKLHQRVRKHNITYPWVIAWFQQKQARKWFLTTKYKVVSYHSVSAGMCRPWECPGVRKICSQLLNHATESINAYIP